MKKFCTHCGRPLEEQEICNCTQAEVAEAQPEVVAVQPEVVAVQPEVVAVQPETATPQPETATPQPEVVASQPEVAEPQAHTWSYQANAPQPTGAPKPQAQAWGQGQAPATPPQMADKQPQVGTYFKRLIDTCVSIVKKPQTGLRQFVASKDHVVGIGFAVVCMIMFGLFTLVESIRINIAFGFFNGDIAGGIFSIIFSVFRSIVLLGLITVALAGATLLFMRVIAKADFNFKQAICVAGSFMLALIPFVTLSVILQFIPTLATVLVALGILLGIVFVCASLEDFMTERKNQMCYIFFGILASTMIVASILTAIIA